MFEKGDGFHLFSDFAIEKSGKIMIAQDIQ